MAMVAKQLIVACTNVPSKKIVCIMGPTACGKTDLAIHVTQRFPADIISVDSAMVYRDMDIGTAKPCAAVLQKTPHRLINLCDPAKSYSAGQFCVDALREINDIIAHQRLPVLVGGTMLYFHKLLYGLADLPTADVKIRQALSDEAEKLGWSAMHERLEKIDPVAAEKIKPQDPQRIQRALEVYAVTGQPISTLQSHTQTQLPNDFQVIAIALIPEDRVWLHDRIAKRFDAMLAVGFVDEVKKLHARADLNLYLPAIRMVGYRQMWEYLDGEIDFDTMKARAIAATRQLAKRQLTWLRSWKDLHVLDPQDLQLFQKVCALVH